MQDVGFVGGWEGGVGRKRSRAGRWVIDPARPERRAAVARSCCRATLDFADLEVHDDGLVPGRPRFTVRHATLGGDLFSAADLRSRCFRQDDDDGAAFYHYRKAVLEWMYNSMQRKDSYCIIAAESGVPEDRRVIGTLDATVHCPPAGETFPRAIYVSSIAVRRDRRRLGVASTMLRDVESLAKRLNITYIFLHVEPWNHPAVKLYKSLEFKQFNSQYCKWLRELSKPENVLLHKNLAWSRPPNGQLGG